MDTSKTQEGLTAPTLSESAKKRGLLQKLTEGGLAERLLKLIQRGKSEISSYEHRVNAEADGEAGKKTL